MGLEATLFCILFSAIFFMLGLMYKIIADFKSDVITKLDKLQDSFLQHVLAAREKPLRGDQKTS